MKTRVRPFTSGLDRTHRAAIRAVLVLFAAVSISGVVLAPSSSAAATSGSDGHGAARAGHGESEEGHDICDHESPVQAADRHVDDEWRSDDHSRGSTCTSSPPARLHTPATPTVQGPPPPAVPMRVSTTPVSPSHPIVALRRPMLVTPREPHMPTTERPPLLAPPALTVPPPGVAGGVSTSPVFIYVITLSTLAVATAIAIAALVLIRRSD